MPRHHKRARDDLCGDEHKKRDATLDCVQAALKCGAPRGRTTTSKCFETSCKNFSRNGRRRT